MKPEQVPITGQETDADRPSPTQALGDFYRAFNGRDLAAMATNWAQTEDIAMDNPLGGITRGWTAIQAVYTRIFHGPARVYVEFFDYTIDERGAVFWAVGRERGQVTVGDQVLDLMIRTSRTYAWDDDRWQQVHHHGSIEDPAMLAAYQQVIRTGRRT